MHKGKGKLPLKDELAEFSPLIHTKFFFSKCFVAHATMFHTAPDQLVINNISSLLPHLYLANTSEYKAMYFLMHI